MAVLAEAGIELVGENRVEQLLAKQEVARERFTWDFIGHLQSRKARDLVGRVRLVHSLSTLSAAERLDRSTRGSRSPAWSRSTSPARSPRRGSRPDELDAFLEAVARAAQHPRRGPHDDAAAGGRPGGLAAVLRGAARARRRGSRSAGRRSTRFARLSMGTSQDYAVAVGGGSDDRPPRIDPLPPIERIVSPLMGLGDVWYKTKVYFGLAEDDDLYEDDEDGTLAEEDLEQRYRRRPNVRPLDARRGRGEVAVDDIFSEDAPPAGRSRRLRDAGGQTSVLRAAEAAGAEDVPKVYLSVPRTFNDAQPIGDRYKRGIPVIINLQTVEAGLAKRLIDFASGLTYALEGRMQRIADKVFLLTPENVELSAEDQARYLDAGFFNQA